MKPGSLALIDQPEQHLHPSLQAALMKAIQGLLKSTDSYALIATNSPTILQEIPSWQVQVLHRHGSITKAEYPIVETYGENPGIIMRHVLNLNAEQQTYMEVLTKLATELPAETIEEIFHQGLSSQARALVMQMQHARQRREQTQGHRE